MTQKPAWYRSLYWRIGLVFVLFLVVVVAVETAAFVWLTSRASYGPPSPSATFVVAEGLGRALSANPTLDIAKFFKDHYEERVPMVAVMKDGRVISSNGVPPSEDLVAATRARLSSMQAFSGEFGWRMGRGGPFGGPRPDDRGFDQPPPGDERGRGAAPSFGPPVEGTRDRGALPWWPWGMTRDSDGRGGPMRRGAPALPIIVSTDVVGAVVANPLTPWQQFGPMLLLVGFALVAAGTASAATLIFAPVRKRLRSLEDAAKQVGRGDLSARAREDGGDEVADLAHAFNQMTSDLASRAEQLQASDRQRRALLADVSHELMTPLTAMRGYLETLMMSGIALDEETRKRYLSIIDAETRRTEHIVGDLLELARLEGARESIDRQDVPVEDLFGRVMARHEREATQKKISLTSTIEPGAELVSGDPLRLEQVLQNLAANALRYTPAGGRIELRAEAHERELVLTVRDTGSGIPPEHLPHVFDRFYKADPSRSGTQTGSGLGLSIVKAIVERHGGTISAKSTIGTGTEFLVRLPI